MLESLEKLEKQIIIQQLSRAANVDWFDFFYLLIITLRSVDN